MSKLKLVVLSLALIGSIRCEPMPDPMPEPIPDGLHGHPGPGSGGGGGSGGYSLPPAPSPSPPPAPLPDSLPGGVGPGVGPGPIPGPGVFPGAYGLGSLFGFPGAGAGAGLNFGINANAGAGGGGGFLGGAPYLGGFGAGGTRIGERISRSYDLPPPPPIDGGPGPGPIGGPPPIGGIGGGFLGPSYVPATWLGSALGAKGDILFPIVIVIFFIVGVWTVINFLLALVVPLIAAKYGIMAGLVKGAKGGFRTRRNADHDDEDDEAAAHLDQLTQNVNDAIEKEY